MTDVRIEHRVNEMGNGLPCEPVCHERENGRKRQAIKLAMTALCLLFASGLTGCVNHMKMGVRLLEEKKYEKALEEFEAASKDKPAESLRGQAMALFAMEDYEGAASAVENAVSEGVYETPQLYNILAVCRMKQSDYGRALEAYNTALALVDTRAGQETIDEGLLQEMRFNQIVCLEQTADWEQAKEKMKAYLAVYPDDEKAKDEDVFLSTR